MPVLLRSWLRLALVPLIAVALFAVAPGSPANAEPNPKPTGAGSTYTGPNETTGDGDEDGLLLNTALESATRKYEQAKASVAKSTSQLTVLKSQLRVAQGKYDALKPAVDELAASEYTLGGNVNSLSSLLGANSPADFMARAGSLSDINGIHEATLRDANNALKDVQARTDKLNAEVQSLNTNAAAMKKQQDAMSSALDLLGGTTGPTLGDVSATSKVAAPAPRNADGGFSPEKCTENDPTTDGCITPRMLHLYNEVRKAGFNRFAGCHRNGGPYEHPKGRACDWSLQSSGFTDAHNEDMKRYGNELMAFLVRNADALGIYYVIWYAQIYWPGQGWHAYHGDSTHKDHVHVSVL